MSKHKQLLFQETCGFLSIFRSLKESNEDFRFQLPFKNVKTPLSTEVSPMILLNDILNDFYSFIFYSNTKNILCRFKYKIISLAPLGLFHSPTFYLIFDVGF